MLSRPDMVPEDGFVVEQEQWETVEYDSVEEFREAQDMAAAIPDESVFGVEFQEEDIVVSEGGRNLYVSFYSEHACFIMNQQDNRDYEGFSSATAYMGEISNERSYTTAQGLSYTMFDTVEDGETESTHAVITLNGRVLSYDFKGFESDVIEKVLESLDLSVYFLD